MEDTEKKWEREKSLEERERNFEKTVDAAGCCSFFVCFIFIPNVKLYPRGVAEFQYSHFGVNYFRPIYLYLIQALHYNPINYWANFYPFYNLHRRHLKQLIKESKMLEEENKVVYIADTAGMTLQSLIGYSSWILFPEESIDLNLPQKKQALSKSFEAHG